MTKDPVGHKRTKHIDIKHQFIREAVKNKTQFGLLSNR